jgi:hypothetical protein
MTIEFCMNLVFVNNPRKKGDREYCPYKCCNDRHNS